jgi:hypothetical protein
MGRFSVNQSVMGKMEDGVFDSSKMEDNERCTSYIGNNKGSWRFTTHGQVEMNSDESPINIDGTSLVGEMECSFYDIYDTFGRPHGGDEYKIDAGWDIEFVDGLVATIYNYKNGLNYSSDGTQLTDITEWHIGGKDKVVVDRIKGMLSTHIDKD